jgi:apolipoprotein N-acyltransferase
MATTASSINSPIRPVQDFQSWLWLAISAVLLLFADGRNTIPAATWLAPALLLRFVRTQPARRGLSIAYLTLLVTRGVATRGMTPIPGIFFYIFLIISGLSVVLPYVADRLIAVHLPGLFHTLVFPCSLVATQLLYSRGPFGSWGLIPYTQAGNLPLIQLLAVTGLWGITFLIGWFAAVVNWTWQDGPSRSRASHPATLFIAVYLLVVLLGGARLALFPPASPTVRVASLSPVQGGVKMDGLLAAVIAGKAGAGQISQLRQATRAGQDELLTRSEREAIAGAKIIFWSETAAYVLQQDEGDLLARGRALAARYQIYLGMALGTWSPGLSRPFENKFVLIAPTGQIAWQYLKARPTPGPEAAMSVTSDGRLRQLDTPYGRLDAAICYDTDFPRLMAQAGEQRADLVLSPAGDWRAIDPRHSEIASFRAVEEGFNLVRQSHGGLSAAYDYQGRRLATMDQYQASDLTLLAQVPTRGVRTIYSRLGDWFGWLCILALVALTALAWHPLAAGKFLARAMTGRQQDQKQVR